MTISIDEAAFYENCLLCILPAFVMWETLSLAQETRRKSEIANREFIQRRKLGRVRNARCHTRNFPRFVVLPSGESWTSTFSIFVSIEAVSISAAKQLVYVTKTVWEPSLHFWREFFISRHIRRCCVPKRKYSSFIQFILIFAKFIAIKTHFLLLFFQRETISDAKHR